MNDMPPLSDDEVRAALRTLPKWHGTTRGLERKLEFEDFRGAMQFMQACVDTIERQNHHPVWKNKYNTVDIHLDTFDVGNFVTELDVALARALDAILVERGHEFGLVEHD